jgi:hypothetical protein
MAARRPLAESGGLQDSTRRTRCTSKALTARTRCTTGRDRPSAWVRGQVVLSGHSPGFASLCTTCLLYGSFSRTRGLKSSKKAKSGERKAAVVESAQSLYAKRCVPRGATVAH